MSNNDPVTNNVTILVFESQSVLVNVPVYCALWTFYQ